MTDKYQYIVEIEISLANMNAPARRANMTFSATRAAGEKLSLWLGKAMETQILMLIKEAEGLAEKQTVSIDSQERGVDEAVWNYLRKEIQ